MCLSITLAPYLVVVHITDRLLWRIIALALPLLFLILCGLGTARGVRHRVRAENTLDLDLVALSLGSFFWALVGCLFLTHPAV